MSKLVIPNTPRLEAARQRKADSIRFFKLTSSFANAAEMDEAITDEIAATIEAFAQHYRIIADDTERGDGS